MRMLAGKENMPEPGVRRDAATEPKGWQGVLGLHNQLEHHVPPRPGDAGTPYLA